ncbi:MAG: hypothetical protein AB1938_03355 [Myxococcota bacterium]
MHVRLFLLTLALTGCERCADKPAAPPTTALPMKAEPPAPPPKPVVHSERAEVEFFGDWKPGAVKAAKVLFVAQEEPCLPVPATPKRYGETVLDKPGPFFAEYFIKQDSRGHVCVYGYDEKGAVVGAASWEKNPLRFFGEGEVIFANMDFTLAEVK